MWYERVWSWWGSAVSSLSLFDTCGMNEYVGGVGLLSAPSLFDTCGMNEYGGGVDLVSALPACLIPVV